MPVAADRDVAPLMALGLTSEDAILLTHTHANVLIVGSPDKHETILKALSRHLQEPTRVLHDVELLNRAQQRELLGWMESAGDNTRVISLSSSALYPLVECGAFLDALYYRLNVLRVDLP